MSAVLIAALTGPHKNDLSLENEEFPCCNFKVLQIQVAGYLPVMSETAD